jgi:hypothetical protein
MRRNSPTTHQKLVEMITSTSFVPFETCLEKNIGSFFCAVFL